MIPTKDEFLLKADEGSEMIADEAMEVIRRARLLEGLDGPVPDPVAISHRNLRTMVRAVYKAGAVLAMEEFINIMRSELP